MSGEVWLKTKELSEMFGVAQNQLISIFHFGRLEPERGEDGALTYSLEDFQQAYVDYQEKQKNSQLENAAELLKRIIPDLQQKVGETVEQRVVLLTALRDSKEAKLVEFLGTLSQMLTRLDSTLTYWVKLAAQLNNAAVAGLGAQMPTVGVNGSRWSLGVDLPVEKNLGRDPLGSSFSSDLIDKDLKDLAEVASASAALGHGVEQAGGSSATSQSGRGEVGSVGSGNGSLGGGKGLVGKSTGASRAEARKGAGLGDSGPSPSSPGSLAAPSRDSGRGLALPGGARGSFSQVSIAGAQEELVLTPRPAVSSTPTSSPLSPASPAASSASSSTVDASRGALGSWRSGRSPLFSTMLPPTVLLSPVQEKAVETHLSFLEHLLPLSEAELKTLASSDLSSIDEVLAPWEEQISDCPKFTTYYSSLSKIKGWVEAKYEKIPAMVMFLAVNRRSAGAVTATDFIYMNNLD